MWHLRYDILPGWADRLLTWSTLIATAAVLIAAGRHYFGPTLPRLAEDSRPRHVSSWRSYLNGYQPWPSTSQPIANLVIFSDYRCEYCSETDSVLSTLPSIQEGSLRVIYRHLPMSPLARNAALASICAEDMGLGRRMHSRLFAVSDSFGFLSWNHIAASVGLTDTLSFDRCLAASSSSDRLTADLNAAEQLRIRSTPALLLDSLLFIGVPNRTYISSYVLAQTTDARP